MNQPLPSKPPFLSPKQVKVQVNGTEIGTIPVAQTREAAFQAVKDHPELSKHLPPDSVRLRIIYLHPQVLTIAFS